MINNSHIIPQLESLSLIAFSINSHQLSSMAISINMECIKDKHLTLNKIIHVVYPFFKITEEQINSKFRDKVHTPPRQIAQTFGYFFTKKTTAVIGEKIGKRDHASVLHSVKQVINHMETEKDYLEDIKILCTRLNVDYSIISHKNKRND
jgi:chromosomal replication initiator protein